MPTSVLEAIELGIWDFEPESEDGDAVLYPATDALPGTNEKLRVLAERLREGRPLWHPQDRRNYSEVIED